MTGKVKFVRDPHLEEAIRRGLGSLNPVGNVLRRATDQIRDDAIALAEADAAEATARRDALRGNHRKSARRDYQVAKARAWALKRHVRLIGAVMDVEDDAIVGIVRANYPGSAAIEFGGTDPHVVIGDTTEPLRYGPHAHLRRALDKAGGST